MRLALGTSDKTHCRLALSCEAQRLPAKHKDAADGDSSTESWESFPSLSSQQLPPTTLARPTKRRRQEATKPEAARSMVLVAIKQMPPL